MKVRRRSFVVGLFVLISAFLLRSLTQFFNRAREMEFFKRIIQIPDLPDVSDTFPHIFPRVLLFNADRNNDIDNCCGGCFPSRIPAFTPQSPPNFLRAAALGEYKRPVAVMPSDEQEEEEAEPQAENRESPQITQVCFQDRKKRNDSFNLYFLQPRLTFCFLHDSIICSVRRDPPRLPRSSGKQRTTA